LFCAFCEDRGLLPAESLKHASEQRNPYNPQPVWLNFRVLFHAIDEGNAGLNIPAYNGGLFAPDPALDALQVPDEVWPISRNWTTTNTAPHAKWPRLTIALPSTTKPVNPARNACQHNGPRLPISRHAW
jgi:hypothetical protein